MINARKKGHAFELACIKALKKIWPLAGSSRNNNRALDSQKVDIVYTDPFLFQCKATETAPNMHDLLNSMHDEGIRVVLHKRNNKGVTATLDFADFLTILKIYKDATH